MQEKIIKPQPGYQTITLSSSADIVISGGAAGAGKTFCLLFDGIRHINVENFEGVIFRKTSPQIRAAGGLWDASQKLYTPITNAIPRETFLEWKFGDKAKLKFSHLQYEKDKFDWQGAEIAFLGFDELTHFSESTFFYMLSRNRSTCGIKPYTRATCNPDPDSWVSKLIAWWIGPDGLPIAGRQGAIRYFMRHQGNYVWGDSKQEVYEQVKNIIDELVEKSGLEPEDFIKSITFVGGTVFENKELLNVDPGYLANLNAQDEETKAQLLDGNWKIKISDKDIYDYYKFQNIFTNDFNTYEGGETFITADVALKGSDKMVIIAWRGKCIIDIKISEENSGKEALDFIKDMKARYKVPNSNICFDNDGVGGGLSGHLEGAVEFHNGARPENGENYKNLKTQCYYKSGDNIGEYYILEDVGNALYSNKQTVKDAFKQQRKAIKRAKVDDDGKLCLIPKSEMKIYNGGESPDLMDAFMMREYFDLYPNLFVV